MTTYQNRGYYERKVTSIERFFTHSPFSVVTMVARIKGHLTEEMLRQALLQVQKRHPHLRARIHIDQEHEPWFTTKDVGEIRIDSVQRLSDHHWIEIAQQGCQIAYDFERSPAIRIVLLHSPTVSEIILLCHHIICDGLSLAYVVRDLMEQLGDPSGKIELLPDPVPITEENIPEDVSLNSVSKYFINRINKQWQNEKIHFDQADYLDLHGAYWSSFQHRMDVIELSKAETLALVDRCRDEGVTVNSALTAAAVGTQVLLQGQQPFHSNMVIAGNLRDRLVPPVGEVMGFYAGAVTLKFDYKIKSDFWDNARKLHKKLISHFTNKKLFGEHLTWCYLDPTILEAFHFKTFGRFVQKEAAQYEKLSEFSERDDVIQSIMKREKMDRLDRITVGTAVTNLTRMNFPARYGGLSLDRLYMKPGGAFPLSNMNLVVGAVTTSDRLSLVLEYVEDNLDEITIDEMKKMVKELLDMPGR